MRCVMTLHFGNHFHLRISRELVAYEEHRLRRGKSIRLQHLDGCHHLTLQDLDRHHDETILTGLAFGWPTLPDLDVIEEYLMDLLQFRWRIDEIEGSNDPKIQKLIDAHNGLYLNTYYPNTEEEHL